MTTQQLLPIIAELREEFQKEDFSILCTREQEQWVDLKSKLY